MEAALQLQKVIVKLAVGVRTVEEGRGPVVTAGAESRQEERVKTVAVPSGGLWPVSPSPGEERAVGVQGVA